jgi:hypothetical protein
MRSWKPAELFSDAHVGSIWSAWVEISAGTDRR